LFDPVTDYDFRVYSDDKKSHITFTLEEYVHERFPSLSCTIEVLDNNYKGWNINVWFTLDKLHSFISELEKLNRTREGKATLKAMTAEDFKITFETYNTKGNIATNYIISKSRYDTCI
jgi:cAMP phosphodiesterase